MPNSALRYLRRNSQVNKISLDTQLPYVSWQEIQFSLNSMAYTNRDIIKCMTLVNKWFNTISSLLMELKILVILSQ